MPFRNTSYPNSLLSQLSYECKFHCKSSTDDSTTFASKNPVLDNKNFQLKLIKKKRALQQLEAYTIGNSQMEFFQERTNTDKEMHVHIRLVVFILVPHFIKDCTHSSSHILKVPCHFVIGFAHP